MEADRDEAWDTFIHLKRIYTVREIKARVGYILHDLHNDDIPVEIVEFASSQAGGDSAVIGSYPGNRQEGNTLLQVETATASEASISPNEVPLVQAAATPSNAEELSNEEESLERTEEETQRSMIVKKNLKRKKRILQRQRLLRQKSWQLRPTPEPFLFPCLLCSQKMRRETVAAGPGTACRRRVRWSRLTRIPTILTIPAIPLL